MQVESVVQSRECVECKQVKPLTGEYFPFSGSATRATAHGHRIYRRICRLCYNAECKVRDRQRGTKQPCKHCGGEFDGRRKNFCSTECRILSLVGGVGARYERLVVIGFDTRKGRKYLLLQCDCGNTTLAAPGNLRFGHIKSCGCFAKEFFKNRFGDKAPGWKGGRSMDTQGYIRLHMPGHPNAYPSDNTVLEHLFVMAEFLGRPIRTRDGEEVHHKNGIRHDNRIENLELWTKSQPPGQRVEDMVQFCREYLKTYAQDVARLHAAQSVSVQPELFT